MAALQMTTRRILFAALTGTTFCLGLASLIVVLSPAGLSAIEWLLLLGYTLTMPYTVIGFWNAVIGLWLRHRYPDAVARMPGVAPLSTGIDPPRSTASTAIVMTLRNEDAAAAFVRLTRMQRSLADLGRINDFTFVVLSDSDDPDVRVAERGEFARFADATSNASPPPIYRRRDRNAGYKAGNIMDFLDTHGDRFDYFLPLDADSLISGTTITRLVAALDQRPEIGILQTLVVGMPSRSGFTRLFQFGMRHAMRAFTTGSAWWTGDCGAYWGHNALVRVAPFRRHCRLQPLSTRLPLGGAILSHDQVEAVLMRRAGYEVRVAPIECESYEINPPTLIDFIQRECRWCQGNMQYLRLLAMPGLARVSRFQLFQAIGMYIAPAAWMGMTLSGCVGLVAGGFSMQYPALGIGLFLGVFLMATAPRLIGALDIAFSPREIERYGGARAFRRSVACELFMSILMAPVVAFSLTLFLIGLVCGRRIGWTRQNRDDGALTWRSTARVFAPHTFFGLGLGASLTASIDLIATLWVLPIIGGLAVAIPFTVWSARPALGTRMARYRLGLIPEENQVPNILAP